VYAVFHVAGSYSLHIFSQYIIYLKAIHIFSSTWADFGAIATTGVCVGNEDVTFYAGTSIVHRNFRFEVRFVVSFVTAKTSNAPELFHGMNPTEARQQGKSLKAYPKMVFALSITGGSEMNYKIESWPSFTIVGVKQRFTSDQELNFSEVPKYWRQTIEQGKIPRKS
jgi:hypothetical protein